MPDKEKDKTGAEEKASTRDIADGYEEIKGETYLDIVTKQFLKQPFAVAALYIFGFLVALFAPLLANNKPIIMKYRVGDDEKFSAEGKYRYTIPALTTYPMPKFLLKKISIVHEIDYRYLKKYIHDANKKIEDKTGEKGKCWAIQPVIPYHPADSDIDYIEGKPGAEHWLGCDLTGRDVASRLIHGTPISLTIGITAVAIALTIGLTVGAIAGFFGGWVDMIVARFIEIMMCFPSFFIILTVIAVLPRNIYYIMIVIGIFGWTGHARLIRGQIFMVKTNDYVMAAKALGVSYPRTIIRHVIPNAIAPVLVSVAFGIAGAILTESGLSFLGFGDTNFATWGEVLYQGKQAVLTSSHLVFAPGIAIFLTVTVMNLLGDGIRDAIDPKLKV